jgi:hypothetical protein
MKGKKIPYVSILLTVYPTCSKHSVTNHKVKTYRQYYNKCAKTVTVYIHFIKLADGLQ